MKKFKELNIKELQQISGRKYYGNGVYCDDKTYSVDWSQAWQAIGDNLVNSIGEGMGGVANSDAYRG